MFALAQVADQIVAGVMFLIPLTVFLIVADR